MQETEEVFIRIDNHTEPLPAKTFREGFAGKSLEDALQALLAENPNLLPGRQMDPGSDSPPKFCLLTREMPVFGWALDHLFVDQYGVLTLVETKLLQNPESRREVIGQILEYAANAREAWSIEKLRSLTCTDGSGIDQKILQTFGLDENALETFWANVERNLELGQLRLIVAADELRPEVRRMLLYLNREMTNVDVFGLEIRFFGDDERQVIVPYLIGAVGVPKSSTGSKSTAWTPELLRDTYKDEPEAVAFLRVLQWACDARVFLKSISQNAGFGIRSSAGGRLATFFLQGGSYFACSANIFKGGIGERDALFQELKSTRLYPNDLDLTSLNMNKNTALRLSDLTSDEVERLLRILGKYTTSSDAGAVIAVAVSSAK